jgi:hypothetical protein
MSQTVADVLVDTLDRIGVRQIFGLIGDSLNPLADAIRRSPIEWIGGLLMMIGADYPYANFLPRKGNVITIRDAFDADGPTILDAVVVADELPNLPHIDLETIGRVALAKTKEAVLAVTGA